MSETREYISVHANGDNKGEYYIWYDKVVDREFIKTSLLRTLPSSDEANKIAEEIAKKRQLEFIPW